MSNDIMRFNSLSSALAIAHDNGYHWARLGDYGDDSEDKRTIFSYVLICDLIGALSSSTKLKQLNEGKDWQYLAFAGGHAVFKTLGRKKIFLFKSKEDALEEVNSKLEDRLIKSKIS